MATAIALVLSYVEAILPPISTIAPGIKIGIPNIVIIFLIYKVGVKEAATVSFIRLVIVSILFGQVVTFAYSLAGAVLSLLVMVMLKKIDCFSMIGVSVAGGVCHNLGQIAVAIFLMGTVQIGYYMAVLAVTGTVAGIFVGVAGSLAIKYVKSIK